MQLIKPLLLISILVLLAGCKTVSETQAYQKFTDQQIFNSAQTDMQKKHYETAVKELEALDALYPFGAYSQKGQLMIIQAYYYNEDKESALAAADRYIRLYPRADDVDEAYYWKGVINQGQPQNWLLKSVRAHNSNVDVSGDAEAFQDFSTLIQQFPDSRYAPEARQRLAALQGVVAQHDLNIVQYYMERKIYVAAVNRAAELVENYPDTPQAASALSLMAKAYQALGEPELSQLAAQRAASYKK